MNLRSPVLLPLAAALSLTACFGPPAPEGAAQVWAEVQTVPAGVGCLRVVFRAPGATADTTRNLAVTPGAAATLDLGYLAAGAYSFRASAFNVACGSVAAATVASWVGDAVSATIAPGVESTVAFTLRPNVTTRSTVDFVQPVRAIYSGRGSSTTWAVMQDGTVRGWGANQAGQLGDGTRTNATTPRTVAGLSGVRQIVGSWDWACAATATSGLHCWGTNWGQLADDDATPSLTPRANVDVEPEALAAAPRMLCGSFGGNVSCWGQGGRPGDASMQATAFDVDALVPGAPGVLYAVNHSASLNRYNTENLVSVGVARPRVAAVVVGGFSYCALSATGAVSCGGAGAFGRLGNGSTDGTALDGPVSTELEGVTSVVGGEGGHYCALRGDRTVWCWGVNENGQTGTNLDTSAVTRPAPVPITDVTQLAAGNRHTCALRGDGSVWCWGYNADGQLGDGTRVPRFTPVRVRF